MARALQSRIKGGPEEVAIRLTTLQRRSKYAECLRKMVLVALLCTKSERKQRESFKILSDPRHVIIKQIIRSVP
ncbi:hypothetical protein H5410_002590 [Solanum commersonii]|uniref:Uncharacterized protein n=1 Tax=Solanum commersonii TaxID=4109 RepID=A0A9J6B2D0_SOLCO|nr:hypothetical protein H5410_002590 [Solanum commersonii]